MNSEKQSNLLSSSGFIVLCRNKSGGDYLAVFEDDFSMGISETQAYYFWSSNSSASALGGSMISTMEEANIHKKDFAKRFPDMEFKIWNVSSNSLPIVLDWDAYLDANDQPKSYKTNKMARNFIFKKKSL
jgi:hypothetical protein